MPEGTIYTCPMHPEVRQVGPGSCPICGMALEPLLASADAGPNPELARHDAAVLDRRSRSRVPVVRARDGRAPDRPASCVGQQTSNWLQLVLATPVVLWAGWPFFVRGWQSLVTRNLNMFTLIAHGHRRRVALQRRRHARARTVPGGVPRPRRRGRGLFRGGRGDHGAGAARPGARAARARDRPAARSARCSTLRRRPRGACGGRQRRGGAARPGRRSATGCACGRARRCRSTAWWSKGAARSTSRW